MASCYKFTVQLLPLTRIDPHLTWSNVTSLQLQSYSVMPSIDLYPLICSLSFSDKMQNSRWGSGRRGEMSEKERKNEMIRGKVR